MAARFALARVTSTIRPVNRFTAMETVKRAFPTQQRRFTNSPVYCAGSSDGPSSPGPVPPPAKDGPRVVSAPPSPSGVRVVSTSPPQGSSGVRVIRVEDREAAWAGVAARDAGEDSTEVIKRTALLVGGDVAALLAFAAIGRISHGETLLSLDLLATAGPFITGWLLAAPFVGGFGEDARGSEVGPAAAAAAKSWAVGIPLGLVIRSIVKFYLPPATFVGISMGVTGVLLVGWRTALAAATPKRDTSPRARKSKQGNPLEFFQLLSGLTKRW